MRRFLAALLLAFAPQVWSAPVATGDALDLFLARKGILDQGSGAGQTQRGGAANMVSHAIGFLGVPYRLGGNDFESGFDCSGFVRAIVAQTIGLLLPRQAEQQAAASNEISASELQPGDLVFFNTLERAYSHVGIYLGAGRFIHSPKPGAQIRVEDMSKTYWTQRFNGARRVQVTQLDSKNSP